MLWSLTNVLVLATWACAAAWAGFVLRRRLREQPRSRSLRERLRPLGLGVLLLPAVQYLASIPLNEERPVAVLLPLVAVLLWTFAPRHLTSKAVPLALIWIGIQGLLIVRDLARGGLTPWHYGVAGFPPPHFVLLQGVAFVLAGAWMLVRSMDPQAQPLRWLLQEPFAKPGTISRPWWGLLLFVVLGLVTEMLGRTFWLDTAWWGLAQTVMVTLATGYVVVRYPGLAADLALAGLVMLGLYGVALGVFWPLHVPLPSPYTEVVRYGAILVTGRGWALLAGLQGLALITLGLWLTPRALDNRTKALFRSAAEAELSVRVVRLTRTRDDAVDTATMQLRQLEHDLHDGAQARLVALGMSLRAAERLIGTDPQAAITLVAEARESSAKALSELRGLVRGICPPVLADRGLGDAVRALALDTPLRTEVEVDLPGRPPLPVETACYFAVAEALANAAKHAGARSAQVRISYARAVLKITVLDDGTGGADPARGTGLRGLERRLEMFDGILAVSSPAGGPTIVAIEVPCTLKEDIRGTARPREMAHRQG